MASAALSEAGMRPNNQDRGNLGKETILRSALCAAAVLALGGCLATTPTQGGGSGNTVTGVAGGATTENANSSLERCTETLGTVAVHEDQGAVWWRDYYRRYPKLG